MSSWNPVVAERAFHDRYGPWAVVAGASEGLGAAFARRLAMRWIHLVLVARRREPLLATANTVQANYVVQVHTVSLDLASPDLQAQLEPQIEGRAIGLLVYNAAFSSIAPYHRISMDDKLRHVAVNCRGPVILSSIFAPPMIERKHGGLLFMSSATGMRRTALLTIYAATKAFTTVLAEGLWQELGPLGVDVLGVIAGATQTPNYLKTQPNILRFAPIAQDPETLAENALRRLGKGYPIWVSTWQVGLVAFLINRLLPRRSAVRFISRVTRQTYRHYAETSAKR